MSPKLTPENPPAKRRYRTLAWFDRKNEIEFYGIQARHNGQWMHCREGKTPCFYPTRAEAQKKIRELHAKAKGGPQ